MIKDKAPPIEVRCVCGHVMDSDTLRCPNCGRTLAQAEELASLMLALRPSTGPKH